jgi:hypothetical protein
MIKEEEKEKQLKEKVIKSIYDFELAILLILNLYL